MQPFFGLGIAVSFVSRARGLLLVLGALLFVVASGPPPGTSHADPMPGLCNGIDDDEDGEIDEDFPDLGAPCSVGTGFCERFGQLVCADDGLGTTCGVSPGLPLAEGTPGSASCTDGVDNDCDGLVDVADPFCREAERCDGFDNDGDGEVDEDFDLGAACSVGAGACQVAGVNVCLPDESAAMCSASPLAPSPEGPAGSTCGDGLDNDCDGLTDLDDPSCGAAELAATCALPIARGGRGASCGGTHEVRFEALHASSEAVVTAELLGLDTAGNVLQAIPVENGDLAHLVSGLGKVMLSSQGNRHQVLAPIPMLRVRVADGGREVEAYCSNLPFLDVVAPSGLLGTVAVQGEATSVRVAIPRVDRRRSPSSSTTWTSWRPSAWTRRPTCRAVPSPGWS